jgi:hypothetical protein
LVGIGLAFGELASVELDQEPRLAISNKQDLTLRAPSSRNCAPTPMSGGIAFRR